MNQFFVKRFYSIKSVKFSVSFVIVSSKSRQPLTMIQATQKKDCGQTLQGFQASTIMTVACHCNQYFCLKTLPMETQLYLLASDLGPANLVGLLQGWLGQLAINHQLTNKAVLPLAIFLWQKCQRQHHATVAICTCLGHLG